MACDPFAAQLFAEARVGGRLCRGVVLASPGQCCSFRTLCAYPRSQSGMNGDLAIEDPAGGCGSVIHDAAGRVSLTSRLATPPLRLVLFGCFCLHWQTG